MHREARARVLLQTANLMDEFVEAFLIQEATDVGMPYRDFHGPSSALRLPVCDRNTGGDAQLPAGGAARRSRWR